MDTLTTGVSNAYDTFPVLQGGGDPNTIDVLWVAKSLHESLTDSLDTTEITAEASVELVELVESEFIDGLIRNLSKETLLERANNLANAIDEATLLDLPSEQAVAIALSLWHGCVCMAKSMRNVDSQGTTYTREIRERGYASLKETWEYAERAGNPWVKRGVTIANLFETNRGNTVVDDWVPQNSPYREGLASITSQTQEASQE